MGHRAHFPSESCLCHWIVTWATQCLHLWSGESFWKFCVWHMKDTVSSSPSLSDLIQSHVPKVGECRNKWLPGRRAHFLLRSFVAQSLPLPSGHRLTCSFWGQPMWQGKEESYTVASVSSTHKSFIRGSVEREVSSFKGAEPDTGLAGRAASAWQWQSTVLVGGAVVSTGVRGTLRQFPQFMPTASDLYTGMPSSFLSLSGADFSPWQMCSQDWILS